MASTTVVLADDHPLVRQGVRAVLEAEPDLYLVGEAGDGLEVVQLIERLKPNVLIVDVMMPGLNGLEVVRQVSQRSPDTRVVVLSMYDNEAYVLEAMGQGAAGYILKDCSTAELIQAIRTVAAGSHYLSPPFSDRVIEAYRQKTKATTLDPYETLTSREREVLHLVAEGCSSSQIAARLGISARTAETHRSNLMRKMGLRTQKELIRYALRRGIIPMEN